MVSIIIIAIMGIVRQEKEIVAVIKIASDSILIDGGAPRFLAERINHQIVITGKIFIIPFRSIKFRLWDVSYTVFARANKPEETRPWAITKRRAPAQPHCVWDIIPAVTSPMCLIEEYAISALMSVCRRHSILAIQAPQRLKVRIGDLQREVVKGKLKEIRNSPYLPNFNKIPARIIDPATGASTWALGSHKWTE